MNNLNRFIDIFFLAFSLHLAMLFLPSVTKAQEKVVIVVGAGGTEEYQSTFDDQAKKLQQLAKKSELASIIVDKKSGDKNPKEILKSTLEKLKSKPTKLWIFLVGHGTFDGKTAKFNLRGPDFSATEMSSWLSEISSPVAIVNCASSSAPFINRLSAQNRVILSATKSGYESNATHFASHLIESFEDPESDIDQDKQVSLLEAFLSASKKVEEFYASDRRLATEHALIDDNGDKLGTSVDFFEGVRVKQKSKSGKIPDGFTAHQWILIPSEAEKNLPAEFKSKRNAIEMEIETLRLKKQQLSEQEYLRLLEPLMLKLARLYKEIETDSN